jgi:hypothetical protein
VNEVELQRLHRASRIIAENTTDRNLGNGEAHLQRLALQVVVGPSVARSAALQAAVLTTINAGKRTYLGGVHLAGPVDFDVLSPLATQRRFGDAARELGAILVPRQVAETPTIVVGHDAQAAATVSIALRIEVEDWRVAVGPARDAILLDNSSTLPLTGVFGAALALSELFCTQFSLHPEAARRVVGFSLWEPGAVGGWRAAERGPQVEYWPSDLWVIGLGHLGQAYLWALASLPVPSRSAVRVMLQDDDLVGAENISTCLLTELASVDQSKARVVARWLEDRGFQTSLIERRFEEGDRVHARDPRLILAGVDSPESRLGVAGAANTVTENVQLLDLGLGARPEDFDEIAMHTSPMSSTLLGHWRAARARQAARVAQTSGSELLREVATTSGLDECGTLRLAEMAVGVPYVGAAAGALAIAEVLRRLAGRPAARTASYRLRDLVFTAAPTFHVGAAAPIAFSTR